MKYYVIAGEASGDLHASNLIKELKKIDLESDFRCWGGDLMEAQGTKIVKHYRDLAFMGFAEVLMNIRTIFKNLSYCKSDILSYQPDVIVLVDYPGFNLKIAEWAKAKNIKVYYYISPQVWAWKQSRVHKIKKFVDKMFVILPFEKGFYQKFDYNVDYVGHPLLDAISNRKKSDFNTFCNKHQLDSKPIIALLPGSRKQEITTILPIMLSVLNEFPDYQFVLAGAPSQTKEFYHNITNGQLQIINNETYSLLEHASAALVTSGTATLETALFEVPQIVCYKGNKISFQIAKTIIKVRFISLVNLIVDKEIVKELIQNNLNKNTLRSELIKITSGIERNEQKENYKELKSILGSGGASKKTAQLMAQYLKNI